MVLDGRNVVQGSENIAMVLAQLRLCQPEWAEARDYDILFVTLNLSDIKVQGQKVERHWRW